MFDIELLSCQHRLQKLSTRYQATALHHQTSSTPCTETHPDYYDTLMYSTYQSAAASVEHTSCQAGCLANKAVIS